MAMPSGRFCNAIPMDKAIALASVILVEFSARAKAIPTAMPSGILCIVTAKKNRKLRFCLGVLNVLNLSNKKSVSNRKIPPNKNPKLATIHPCVPCACALSMAGNNKDQMLAAIITPEAKPNNTRSKLLLGGFFKNITNAEPMVVRIKGNIVPKKA